MTGALASLTAAENKLMPDSWLPLLSARSTLQGLLGPSRRIADGKAEAAEDQDDVHFR